MICTTPRSGSTLLCRLLAQTGVAGQPDSHFHTPSLERWRADYAVPEAVFADPQVGLRAVFDAAIRRGCGGTDVFGLRMQRGSFGFFLEQLQVLQPGAATDAARLEAVFGPMTYIHLTRCDRLGQAISRVMAEQTGLWHRHADGRELERSAPPKAPVYDAGAIARHMADLTELDAGWLGWFDKQGLAPLRITYDALSDDPRAELARVLTALGKAPERALEAVIPTWKLADQISDEWRARFEAEDASTHLRVSVDGNA